MHPLEAHKTLLNSFMFNVQLVLLCVLPCVQFCTQAFSQYARYSEADVIFGTQMKYIDGFVYFWKYNVFLFTILGLTLLSIIYFVRRGGGGCAARCGAHSPPPPQSVFPSDRRHLNAVMAKIKAQKSGEQKSFERKLGQQGGALSMV